MKIYLFKILFVLSQLVSLLLGPILPFSSLQAPQLQMITEAIQQDYKLNALQKKQFEKAILQAAGVDDILSQLEWHSYLRAQPAFASNKAFKSFFTFIDHEFKNNPNISVPLRVVALKAAYGMQDFNQVKNSKFDLLVYGNELTSVAAAVTAVRAMKKLGIQNPQVVLVRSNSPEARFGGLLTQGGLAYLDRNQMGPNLTPSSEFYREFLSRAKVKKIAADPQLVDLALRDMLLETKVTLLHSTKLKPLLQDGQLMGVITGNNQILKADSYIDTTQNADLARACGLKYSLGFQSLGFIGSTLPVSPIFTSQGLSIKTLQAIEHKILGNPVLMKQISDKLYAEYDKKFVDWLLSKVSQPMFVGQDFIDFRSPALGLAYHLYRQKPYDFKKGFLFDRPNIAVLSNGDLSWNAFLYKFNSTEALNLADSGSKPTNEMLDELKQFELWLNVEARSIKANETIKILAPEELYIRHTLNITDVKTPLSGWQMLNGGKPAEDAVGTFCYHFDVRGGIDGLSGKMPKPTFNFGIEHSLVQPVYVQQTSQPVAQNKANPLKPLEWKQNLKPINNLAVVGRSAGYVGLAPAAGRILELNVGVASAIGTAAALVSKAKYPHKQSSKSNTSLQPLSPELAPEPSLELVQVSSREAKELLQKLSGLSINLSGRDISADYKDLSTY